jgi:hypothetical protein
MKELILNNEWYWLKDEWKEFQKERMKMMEILESAEDGDGVIDGLLTDVELAFESSYHHPVFGCVRLAKLVRQLLEGYVRLYNYLKEDVESVERG